MQRKTYLTQKVFTNRVSFLVIWIIFLNLYFRASGYSRSGRTSDYTRPIEYSRSAVNPSSYSAQPSAASTGSSSTVRYGTREYRTSQRAFQQITGKVIYRSRYDRCVISVC